MTAADASRVRTLSARLVSTIGTRVPSTMPAPSAPARYCSCLASMLPASRSGTSRMSACPATGETIFLVCAASSLIALSNASGPSRRPPVIWPRSAILHSAAASSVDWIFGLTVSTAERIATFGCSMPRTCARSIAFWHDVGLVLEVGRDVDRRVGDEQQPRVGGHVHDEDVADAPRGAQAGRRRHHRAHQLVGVQAALHQRLDLARARHRDRLLGGGVAVLGRRRSGRAPRSTPLGRGDRADLRLRPDEHRHDQLALGRLDRRRAASRGRTGARPRSSPAARPSQRLSSLAKPSLRRRITSGVATSAYAMRCVGRRDASPCRSISSMPLWLTQRQSKTTTCPCARFSLRGDRRGDASSPTSATLPRKCRSWRRSRVPGPGQPAVEQPGEERIRRRPPAR